MKKLILLFIHLGIYTLCVCQDKKKSVELISDFSQEGETAITIVLSNNVLDTICVFPSSLKVYDYIFDEKDSALGVLMRFFSDGVVYQKYNYCPQEKKWHNSEHKFIFSFAFTRYQDFSLRQIRNSKFKFLDPNIVEISTINRKPHCIDLDLIKEDDRMLDNFKFQKE